MGDEDVRALVERGLHAGVFKRAKKEMVEGVLSLDNLPITAIMTPRSKIVFLNIDDNEETNWRKIVTSGHSYFPVYQTNRDQVVGMVSVKALWAHSAIGLPTTLKNLLVPAADRPGVDDGDPAARAVQEDGPAHGRDLRRVRRDPGPRDADRRIRGDRRRPAGARAGATGTSRSGSEDGSWLVDAALPIADFKAILGISGPLPNEAEAEYRTAGGFAVTQFGRIPAQGDHFEWGGWRFEVAEMDRRRVDKVVGLAAPRAHRAARPRRANNLFASPVNLQLHSAAAAPNVKSCHERLMQDPFTGLPTRIRGAAPARSGGSDSVFRTITADDWRRSLASARRQPNAVSEQIRTAISSSSRKTK